MLKVILLLRTAGHQQDYDLKNILDVVRSVQECWKTRKIKMGKKTTDIKIHSYVVPYFWIIRFKKTSKNLQLQVPIKSYAN